MRTDSLFRIARWTLVSVLLLTGCPTRRVTQPPPPTPTPVPVPESTFRRAPKGTLLTGFERMAGWEVIASGGEARLEKSTKQAVWGTYGGELRFTPDPGEGGGRVVVVPETPWRSVTPFNALQVWAKHEGEEREGYRLRLRARDQEGQARDWSFAYSPGSGWQLLHRRENDRVKPPLDVEALIWDIPEGVTEEQTLWLDNLYVYQEVLARIPQQIHSVRPFGYAPAFAPVRANSVQLDFPTSAKAFRPNVGAERQLTTTEKVGEGVFRFVYEDPQMRLPYRVEVRPGGLDVIVESGEADGGDRMRWTGLKLSADRGIPELRYARLNGDRLWLQFTEGFSCEVFLDGHVLVLEGESLTEAIRGLDMGWLEAAGGHRLAQVKVPFFRVRPGWQWPVVSWKEKDGSARLATCYPDWWSSMAGDFQAGEASAGGFALGRLRYPARWRGSRNIFRERLLFVAGRRLEEVLPSPAHPQGLYRERLETELWRGSIPHRPEQAFGVPGGLQGRTVALLRADPTDEEWEDDLPARSPEGDWRAHPTGGWIVKSGRLDDMPLSSRVQEGTWAEALAEIAITARPPWAVTDYDVRLPGAGTFAQSWVETGAFLQQVAAENGGPVVGRAGGGWFWSGLVAGLVPEVQDGVSSLHPLVPHFVWRTLRPGSLLLGLGEPSVFRFPDEEDPGEAVRVDRMLACMLAYGATGRIPRINDSDAAVKAERFLEVLHPRLAGLSLNRLAYADGKGGFVNEFGEALNQGLVESSKLYVLLGDKVQMMINGDRNEVWEARLGGTVYRLPPFGFVVLGEDFLALSGSHEDGSPLNLIKTPDTVWLHSPEQEMSWKGLRAKGCVWVRKGAVPNGVRLLIRDWPGEVRFTPESLGLDKVGTVEAVGADGIRLPDATLIQEDGQWVLRSEKAPARVDVFPTVRGVEKHFVP